MRKRRKIDTEVEAGLIQQLIHRGLFRVKEIEVHSKLDKKYKPYCFTLHWLLFVLGLYLWDREINFIFGISLFPLLWRALIGQGFSILVFGAILIFEFLPWVIVTIAFGFPVSRIIKVISKKIGLKRSGKHVAKGVRNIATWYLGAQYITFIYGGILRLIG